MHPPSPEVRTHHQDQIHCLDPLVSKPTAERPRPLQFRHTILCLAVILSCVTHGSDVAYGQSPALQEAAKRSITLYQQGRYSEAISYAANALKLGEDEFGPDHPFTATLMNNLAEFYRAQGNYAEAAPL